MARLAGRLRRGVSSALEGEVSGGFINAGHHNYLCGRTIRLDITDQIKAKPIRQPIIKQDNRRVFLLHERVRRSQGVYMLDMNIVVLQGQGEQKAHFAFIFYQQDIRFRRIGDGGEGIISHVLFV